MNRPSIGTTPTIAERDIETYLDFVQGMFAWLPGVQPAVARQAEAALAAWRARHGRDPQTLDEIHDALDRVPLVQIRNRWRRDIQEMKYYATRDDLEARRDELLAELDRYDRLGPGSVEWDPQFPVPAYATRDIHLLPGGYVHDPLAGYYYHAGTRIFYAGANDEDQLHISAVARLPVPADGQVRRVLDLGCSSGQAATALKQRFPQAEVWGIDVGAPMVRYAHKRAVEMGLEVHFAQRLAENTGFPDGWFDIVHAYILFHEVPPDVAERIVAEAARVLRPGGLFLVLDFGTRDAASGRRGPLGELYAHVDAVDNCEPYAWDFTHSDFGALLRRYFPAVDTRMDGGLPLRIATR